MCNDYDVFILNKPFLGSWLDEEGNISHEIINFFKSDNGKYYVYNQPWGICPSDIVIEGKEKGKNKAKFLLLCSGLKGRKFYIQYIIELKRKMHNFHYYKEDKKLNNSIKEIMEIVDKEDIKYGGKKLYEIYFNDKNLLLTFEAEKIYKCNSPIEIGRDKNFKYIFQRNKGYVYKNKKFKKNNNESYEYEFNVIKNKVEEYIKDNKPISLEKVTAISNDNNKAAFTFLDLTNQYNAEQAFTNIFSNLFKYSHQFLKDLLSKYSSKESDFSWINKNSYIKSEYSLRNNNSDKGRIDIYISDIKENPKHCIIIENKIYSGLNGIKNNDKSQLTTYFDYLKDINHKGFIFCPSYRIEDIKNELEYLGEDKLGYQFISYKNIVEMLEKDIYLFDNSPYFCYIKDIIQALKKHSYESELERYKDLFYKAINK